jgi:hypothetical protein
MYVAIGVSVVALIIAVVRSRSRALKDPDLGVVSHQWLAEQRHGRPDSQR